VSKAAERLAANRSGAQRESGGEAIHPALPHPSVVAG
jgi:hypothetical protein